MRLRIQEAVKRVPAQIAAVEKRRKEVGRKVERLVSAMADGLSDSFAVGQTLRELEASAHDLDQQIDDFRSFRGVEAAMPDDDWVHRQLEDFAGLLRTNPREGAVLLRELLGKVTVHEIRIPGKQRGFKQLRFTLQTWGALRIGFGDRVPGVILSAVLSDNEGLEDQCPEFFVDLDGPTRMDLAGPVIAKLREEGVHWKEISKIVNLALGNAFQAWKRYLKGQAEDGQAA